MGVVEVERMVVEVVVDRTMVGIHGVRQCRTSVVRCFQRQVA